MDYSSGYPYAQAAENTMVGSSAGASHHKTAQIQAWAADTSGSPVEQPLFDFQNNMALPTDETWYNGAPHPHGCLSHSNSSDGSDAVNSVPMQRLDVNNLSQSGASSGFPSPEFHDMIATSHGNHSADLSYHLDGQQYQYQDETAFSLSPSDQHMFRGEARDGTYEPNQGYIISSAAQNMRPDLPDGTDFRGWSQDSVASSLSSYAYVSSAPTSLSMDHYEDSSLATAQFAGNGTNQLPHSIISHPDAQSTVRPNQGLSRSHLPEDWIQSPSDVAGQASSPVSTFPSSRRSSNGEPLSARQHPLYKLQARKEDGHYKCTYIEDGRLCDHESFKLKCNYDKHLDSHLKPYRCKWPGCAENPFSSTACLLRHEREKHQMHNHKEVLCKFPDCDRSQPTHGFPRKWNAHDHMKRVHRYTNPEDSTSNSGEASSPSASSQMDMGFSEVPAPTGNPASKRRIQNNPEVLGNITNRKPKPSGKAKRGVGHSVPIPSENSRGQSFMQQDPSYGQNITDWTHWHNGQLPTPP